MNSKPTRDSASAFLSPRTSGLRAGPCQAFCKSISGRPGMGFRCFGVVAPALLLLLVFVHLPHAVNGEVEYACKSLFFPFCDTTKPVEDRANDLISRLSLKEKIQQLGDEAPGIPRLGIPSYEWWSEALHGVAMSPGVNFSGPVKAATSFPQTILTAASFNDTLFHKIGQVASTEGRAMYNLGQTGLTFWSPNVNIFRDPRWGRGQETPGEDPMLASNYAIAFVRGMQERVEDPESTTNGDLPGFKLKTSACCKHFAAYDVEKWGEVNRRNFNALVTQQDMEDTFNPPFQSCIKEGRASSLMCSFNRVNGVPMCGSHAYLTEIARNNWGFDGYIVSDCDAVYNMTDGPAYSQSLEDAVADSLLAGLDLDCGITFRDHAEVAMSQGKLNESHLDTALKNVIAVQMRLGLFDGNPRNQIYGDLGVKDVCSAEHQALALEAALQGIVLLKNDRNTLPLSQEKIQSLAVLGPSATDTENRMLGNYAGIPCIYVTPVEGLAQYVRNIKYQPGCNHPLCVGLDFDEAASAAAEADAVVIVVGLSPLEEPEGESEGLDRTSLLLPGNQQELISMVAKVAKGPVILVIISGGPVDVSFAKEDPLISSIIWAGYPGQAGGHALAEIIFGDSNPGGKLPMTWYPESFTKVPMTNMNMRPDSSTGYPGRSYRFYTEEPVFAFGDGLSYSTFGHTFKSAPLLVSVPLHQNCYEMLNMVTGDENAECTEICTNLSFDVKVLVRNEGSRSGSTVVMLYSVPPKSGRDGVVLKTLLGYQRVYLQAGEETELVFHVQPCKDLSTVKANGERSLDLGEHQLSLGNDIQHSIQLVNAGKENTAKGYSTKR